MKKRVFLVFIVLFLMLALPLANAMAESSSVETHDYDYLCTTDTIKGNCVEFVKKLVPTFPAPSYTIKEKESHINSYVPDVGSVAIMTSNFQAYDENTKQYYYTGHVGYVEKVSDDRKEVTIVDAHFGADIIQRRVGTESELHIVGYYDPDDTSVRFYEYFDGNGWKNDQLVCNGTCLYLDMRYGNPFPNDQLKCIEILSDGVSVTVYEHSNFSGRSYVIEGKGKHNLADVAFENICSSCMISGK